MALPTSDPKITPGTIYANTGSYTLGGQEYNIRSSNGGGIDYISIFARFYATNAGGAHGDAGRIYHFIDNGTNYFSGNYIASNYAYLYCDPSYTTALHMDQPICYEALSAAAIIYSVARWECGIATADIDSTSFTATDYWADTGNNMLFSAVFCNENTLTIIKEICEQSYSTFVYVNGSLDLACGYLEDVPADTPDWTLTESEIVSIASYGQVRDRQYPGIVKCGCNVHHMPNATPIEGYYTVDVGVSSSGDELLGGYYAAKYVDHPTDADWPGAYVAWSDYYRLEVEVGAIGYLMDLDEAVQVYHAALHLSQDADYPDNFRIHKIIYHPVSMTATLVLLKKYSWNIS